MTAPPTPPARPWPPGTPASTAAACQTRLYEFNTNGDRIKLTRRGANTDGSCATTGGAATTWSYNAADQLTAGADGTGSYVYEGFGRAMTVPAIDTPGGTAAGDLAIGYYDTDAVRSLTQNGVSTTYTLDAAGRRLTAATGGPSASTLVRHYTDASDNPGWTETTTGGTTTATRYAGSLGGDLAATITGTGAVQLPLANLHGDTVTTVDIPASGPATSIGAWSDYDEYGAPRNTTAARAVGGPTGNAWLGTKERATDTTGFLLMGARLYNPTTGQFTSADPVYGGNDTAYAYPSDPINGFDLNGQVGIHRPRWLNWQNAKRVSIGVSFGVCVFASAGACAVAGVAAAAIAARSDAGGFGGTSFRNKFLVNAAWAVGQCHVA